MKTLRFVAIIALASLSFGCKQRPAAKPVTPAQYRAQKAAIVNAYKAGKLTTTNAQNQLDALKDGVQVYCDDHYCGG